MRLFELPTGLTVNLGGEKQTKIMVPREVGHLARQRWVMDGHQLEVVNSYPYLGYKFTTKLSANKGDRKSKEESNRYFEGILEEWVFNKKSLVSSTERQNNALNKSSLCACVSVCVWGLSLIHISEPTRPP